MNRRFYTPEIDARVLAVFEYRHGSPERAASLAELARDVGRSQDAIRARHLKLNIDAGTHVPGHRPSKFTAEEDAALLALAPYPSADIWADVAQRLGRPSINSLRHRRAYLKNERGDTKRPRRPDRDARFRVPLPAAAVPAWFEHPITRDRLMAGR